MYSLLYYYIDHTQREKQIHLVHGKSKSSGGPYIVLTISSVLYASQSRIEIEKKVNTFSAHSF